MAVDLSKVEAAVTRSTTVKDSAIAFINSVPQLIRDAVAADDINDATNINALADQLEAKSTALAEALTANTPSAGNGGEGGEG